MAVRGGGTSGWGVMAGEAHDSDYLSGFGAASCSLSLMKAAISDGITLLIISFHKDSREPPNPPLLPLKC